MLSTSKETTLPLMSVKRLIHVEFLEPTETFPKTFEFEADLDTRLSNPQWERLFLEEGIVLPTGLRLEPEHIRKIAITTANEEIQPPSTSLVWLEDQVNEICNLARL